MFHAKTNKYLAGRSEKEVYKKLGLSYIEPELRENTGELETKTLPKLISYDDIKGDFHMHTNWSDGSNTQKEMAVECKKMKYQYCAISDHSVSEHIANGMDEKRILKYLEALDKINIPGIRVFKASEVDIKADGELDYSSKILKQLDLVIASVHSGFKSSRDQITSRVLKAMENPYVTILGHPTGRLINAREPYDIDLDRVFRKAVERNIAIEVNAFPTRLDIKDVYIKQAVEAGCTLVINTDSHSADHLRFIEYGISQARRGWAEARNVLNTQSLGKVEKFIKR